MTGASSFAGSRAGFVNFAVYQNDGGTGNWITDLGVGGVVTNIPGVGFPAANPAPNGFERNVFFYQISRTDSGDPDAIVTLTAPFGHDPWKTMGFLSGTVFTDAGGSVVGSDTGGNNSLDAAGVTGFAASGAAVDPVTTLGTLDNGGGAGDFWFTTPVIGGGDHSSVTFFTSDSLYLRLGSAFGGSRLVCQLRSQARNIPAWLRHRWTDRGTALVKSGTWFAHFVRLGHDWRWRWLPLEATEEESRFGRVTAQHPSSTIASCWVFSFASGNGVHGCSLRGR